MAVLEQVDLRTVPNNLNREDVMQQIVDISKIPMPFQDLIGTDSHTNEFFEWPVDRLPAPAANRVIDGAASGTPVSSPAVRIGNHSQISRYDVGTSYRVQSSNNVGNESLARQISKYTQTIQRDMDMMLLQNVSSVADTGTGGTAGVTAGLEAWLDMNTMETTPVAKSPVTVIDQSGELTMATAVRGYNPSTKLVENVLYAALTTPAALSYANLMTILDGLYQLGANPSKLLARPALIRRLSAYMFTSSAQIATLIQDQGKGQQTAVGSVNQLISDYGFVVDFIPNRLQALSGDGTPTCSTLFAIDPSYLSVSYQGGGIKAEALPVSGLSKATSIWADYGLCVKSPDSVGAIISIAEGSAVVP